MRLLRHAACLAIVFAIVCVYLKLISVNATTVALTFLLAVLLIATVWGLAASVTTSVAAVLAFNFFFLPPVGTLTVEFSSPPSPPASSAPGRSGAPSKRSAAGARPNSCMRWAAPSCSTRASIAPCRTP